ncbi:MAG: hypothetical protein WKG00_22290 [Polyangiaceae bacterium]
MSPIAPTPLPHLDDAWRERSAGARLAAVRRAAPRLREAILASGRVDAVRTFDVTPLPYPTRFGLEGAALSPIPYLTMTNRAVLVQYRALDGQRQTLLFNPTDAERSAQTPFFAGLQKKMGSFLSEKLAAALQRPKPHEQLASVGLTPADIDWLAFDHLHTQDVRATLGTGPEDGALPPYFPRARMLVWRPELEIFGALHPLQEPWYIRDGIRGVPASRWLVCDGDVLLGRGLALVRTPGHTVGNWSLVMNTERGVWAISENGIACDSYAPEHSRIPGVARFVRARGAEVILNSNTLEMRNEQYTSMILEKALVDRCADAPQFFQHFASSELTPSPLGPGLSPTYRHGSLTLGQMTARGTQASLDRLSEARVAS